VYVVDALKRWEPRVVVAAVQVGREQKYGQNVLAIRIRYDVISTNVPGNNVVLSDVQQLVRM
jgi:phage baseplate assembly protein W